MIAKNMKKIKVDLQLATSKKKRPSYVPSLKTLTSWVSATLSEDYSSGEIGIRVVDEKESAFLNNQYRQKSYPTNILSFSYNDLLTKPGSLSGDLVICASLLAKEARDLGWDLKRYWALIVIHGCLHLAGFDHQTLAQAKKMEAREDQLLQKLKLDPT
jgi:probable rRNA maturation factor